MNVKISSILLTALLLASFESKALTPVRQDVHAEVRNAKSMAIYRVVSGKCLEFLKVGGCKRAQYELSVVSRLRGVPSGNVTTVRAGIRPGFLPLGSLVLGYENSYGHKLSQSRQEFGLLPIADISINGVEERVIILSEEEVAPNVRHVGFYERGSNPPRDIIFNENTGRYIIRVAPFGLLLKVD